MLAQTGVSAHLTASEEKKNKFMSAIILTAHTLIVLGLIVVVLLQRSDGGALGLGGGGGGGFMTGRGAANALTRTTSVLAALFFATSVGLAILAGGDNADESIIEELTGQAAPTSGDPNALTADDLLGTLGASDEPADAAPAEAAEPDLDAVLDSLGTEAEAAVAPAENDGESEPADEETPQ